MNLEKKCFKCANAPRDLFCHRLLHLLLNHLVNHLPDRERILPDTADNLLGLIPLLYDNLAFCNLIFQSCDAFFE